MRIGITVKPGLVEARDTLVEFPGATHFVFLTHPDQVERAMRAFLAQVR